LPELDREEILAQRFEKREQLQIRKEMLRKRGLLRSANEDTEDDSTPSKKKKGSSKSSSSKASAAATSREDRNTRAKMEKQESLSDLKAKRNAAKEKAQNKVL